MRERMRGNGQQRQNQELKSTYRKFYSHRKATKALTHTHAHTHTHMCAHMSVHMHTHAHTAPQNKAPIRVYHSKEIVIKK